jgi:hypothetical protein
MFRRMIAAALILIPTLSGFAFADEPGAAQVVAPVVAQVEVRGGPSPVFPVTGTLRAGERVTIHGMEGDYLKITPPEDASSLIPIEYVKRQGDAGIVEKEGAESLMAGADGKATNVRASRPPQGAQLVILGELELDGQKFYRIRPHVGEFRYIPASAVKPQSSAPAAGASPAAAQGNDSVEALLRQAEAAYRDAENGGDWETARRLYEELAKCPQHDARMLAWNRLEFIRRRAQGGSSTAPAAAASRPPGERPTAYPASRPATGQAAATPTGRRDRPAPVAAIRRPVPVSSAPRAGSTYTYATDQGPGQPVPQSTWAPTTPGASSGSPRPAAEAPADTGTPATVVGKLNQARQTADGKPLYYLEGSQGELRCYVTPAATLRLDGFINQIVELRGSSYAYRGDLRGWHLTAVQVTPR